MALEDIPYILPLGNFNPPGHVFPTNHLYFQIRRSNPSDANSPTERVALVAPGDLTMTAIRASENLTRGTADYSLTFVVCEEFSGYLNHVTTLVPELVDLYQPPFRWCNGPYTAGSEQFRLCEKEVAIRLGAGDPIGTVGGEPGVFAFDFGAIDGRLPALAFANPQRWSPDERKRACALDYFTNEVKQTLQAKLDRSIEPVCGEIEQDEPATAQGIWFLPGTSVEDDRAGAENQAITLAHDNVDPRLAVFAVGTSMQKNSLAPGLYYFDPLASRMVNRYFKEITADGQLYCFETRPERRPRNPTTVIAIQLTTSTTLRAEKLGRGSCGNGPWEFTANAVDYER